MGAVYHSAAEKEAVLFAILPGFCLCLYVVIPKPDAVHRARNLLLPFVFLLRALLSTLDCRGYPDRKRRDATCLYLGPRGCSASRPVGQRPRYVGEEGEYPLCFL